MSENLFGDAGIENQPKQAPLITFDLGRDVLAGPVVSAASAAGGITSVPFTYDMSSMDDYQLIRTYRELANTAEIDGAIQEIRNEGFITDVPGKRAFQLSWYADAKTPTSIREKIEKESIFIYNLIDFEVNGPAWFEDWFVDGEIYLQKFITAGRGVVKVRPIDPLKIRQVKIIPVPDAQGTYDMNKVRDVYIYRSWDPIVNPMNRIIECQVGTNINGLQISPDAITHVNSGLFDRTTGRYVGRLKKAIIPYNNMKMMEEAMIIFRVVRAPQRRAFYIDVSGLQKNKAEQYIQGMMQRFQTKMVYDTKTGSITDKRNLVSMMEDYWLPRRDGAKGTEISTIEGQSAQDILDEVEYMRDKLWRALDVPRGRFQNESTTFDFGRGTQIQRDEYRFTKYITTLRRHFMPAIDDLLRTHLIAKRVIKASEWDQIHRDFFWQFAEDNNFVELKETELLNSRLALLQACDSYVGKYFSMNTVKKTVLRQSDAEIAEEMEQIKKEIASRQPQLTPPVETEE